jgi:hypothetical protein
MSAQQPADQGPLPSIPTEPGTPVRVRYRKWDETPHWVFDARYLGSDEHGAWVGFQAGTRFARPGARYRTAGPGVGFFGDVGWTPVLYRGHPDGMRLYTDLTTVPQWRRLPAGVFAPRGRARFEVTAVDLDLDVIAFESGADEPRDKHFIDDEDEFADHTLKYGYPPSVVAQVRADADALLAAVRAGEPPYDGATAERWFAVLDAL